MDWAALYEEDVEGWAEAQVVALRRLATTPGPWSNVIDFENVIEEVENLSSERKAAESLLRQAFAHLIKISADPESLAVRLWRIEFTNFVRQAQAKLRPSMRQKISLDDIWLQAIEAAANALGEYDRELPADLLQRCPFSFDEIETLDPRADLKVLLLARQRP